MSPHPSSRLPSHLSSGTHERDVLLTLFDLGRQVASMVDLDELLQKIPDLIARLIPFDAFAVYLLDEKRGEMRVGYGVGYPDTTHYRPRITDGIGGQAASAQDTSGACRSRPEPDSL